MPTHDETNRFKRDYRDLSDRQRAAFKKAVEAFVADLRDRNGKRFRASLRVKGVRGAPRIFEMRFGQGGRATFSYGDEVTPGEPHVIWRRVGDHSIFGEP